MEGYVAITYHPEDYELVLPIMSTLKAKSCEVWTDRTMLSGAPEVNGRALKYANAVLVVASSAYEHDVASNGKLKRELELAMHASRARTSTIIINVGEYSPLFRDLSLGRTVIDARPSLGRPLHVVLDELMVALAPLMGPNRHFNRQAEGWALKRGATLGGVGQNAQLKHGGFGGVFATDLKELVYADTLDEHDLVPRDSAQAFAEQEDTGSSVNHNDVSPGSLSAVLLGVSPATKEVGHVTIYASKVEVPLHGPDGVQTGVESRSVPTGWQVRLRRCNLSCR